MKNSIFILLFAALLLTSQAEANSEKGTDSAKKPAVNSGEAEAVRPPPPGPPVREDFEADPVLSIFPRVAAVRPESGDELLPFYSTYMDHLVRTSGVINLPRQGSQRCLKLKSINSVDSVAWFAPLAVTPNTHYRAQVLVKADLPEQAEAGLGIIEFDQFLWIGQQFTKAQLDSHQVGNTPLTKITGVADWQKVELDFTTGPGTKMIHLLLFRDGPSAKLPVLFDDIEIRLTGT